jgi:CBS domain-containing protein
MKEQINAGDICIRVVTIAYKGMALNEAARLMREHHVGCLVVGEQSDLGHVVVGMLTDRDIVTGVVARDGDPRLLSVGDAMTAEIVTAREGDSIIDLLRSMRRKGVRRVPITDAGGVLIGLVALDDLLKLISEEMRLLLDAMETAQQREPQLRP